VSVLWRPAAPHIPGTPAVPGEQRRPGRQRVLGLACLPAVACYLAGAALLALVTVVSAGAESSVAGAAQAGAVAVLAAHQVPLTIAGAPLGVLPLLPTLLLGAGIARAAQHVAVRSAVRSPVDAAWVAGAIAGTHGVLGAALALLATPASVTAQPLSAAAACSLVAGVAAVAGLARPYGLLTAALRRAPGWVRPGLQAGGAGLGVLLAAGLGAVLLGLVVSAPEVLGSYEVWGGGVDGVGSVLGLSLLSIGYLPNAAIAGLSWLAGSGVSVGAVSASSVATTGGRVPAVPLLAALPDGPAQSWWACALLVPVLTGVAVGRRCAAVDPDPNLRLRALGVAAAVLTGGSLVLAFAAGGRLGTGAFDPVAVPAGSLAVAVLAATVLGGSAGALLFERVELVPAEPSPEPEPTDEPVPAEKKTSVRAAAGEATDPMVGEPAQEAPADPEKI
jgi:hypothetical protein